MYKLREQGYFPIALGRNRAVGQQFTEDGIPFISLDLTNREDVLKAFQGCDKVVHCAGLSTVWGSSSEFQSANVTAVKYLLEACQINEVKKLVHISTPSLYFNYEDRYLIKESDPLPKKFVNDYAKKSKKEGEDLINQSHNISTTILRPRGIFGPGDTSVFPRLLQAMERKMLPLINRGKALIDITYVDNVVDAIILALEAGKIADGKTYNITNDEPTTFIALMELLGKKMGFSASGRRIPYVFADSIANCFESIYRLFDIKNEPPFTRYTIGLLAKSMTLDISKAKNELGYRPKISLEEGMEAFVSSLNGGKNVKNR